MFNFNTELAPLRPSQREEIVQLVHKHYPGLKYSKGDLRVCDPDFGYQVAMNIIDRVWVLCEYPFIEDEDDITPEMIPDCDIVDMAEVSDSVRTEWIKGYYDSLDSIREEELIIAECGFEQDRFPSFNRNINGDTLSVLTSSGNTSVELALSVMNILELLFPCVSIESFTLSADSNRSYDSPIFINVKDDIWIASGRDEHGVICSDAVDLSTVTIGKWDKLSKKMGYSSIPEMINGCGEDWILSIIEGLYRENMFPDYLSRRK